MHLLVFGDSITQGFHDDDRGGWVSRLFAYCVHESVQSDYNKDVSVFNLGVSGDRSCDLIKRFEIEFTARQNLKMVTLFAIGTNDSARHIQSQQNWCSISDYTKHLTEMIARAKEKGRVVLVGLSGIDESVLNPVPWFYEYAYLQDDRDRYDGVLQELSEMYDCEYIHTEDMFAGKGKELLLDGLHPNAEGHRLIFERVKSKLQEAGIL